MGQLVTDIRSLHLGVADLQKSLAFYTHVWGLQEVGSDGGVHYLRAGGREHHVLALSAAAAPALLGISMLVPDCGTLETIAAAFASESAGAPPRPLPAAAGGGMGIDAVSPEGLRVTLSADVCRHADPLADPTVPARLSHIVLNTGDAETQIRFFIDRLGFRLSDYTDRQYFLRCGVDHHSIAIAIGTGLSLNHAAFEMADFDAVMRGSGRLIAAGTPIEWGPGRHGPGDNIFCYFIDPDGFAIEYTTEVEQVDDASYPTRDAAYWASLPRRPCTWGVAGRPSPRMAAAFSGRTVTSR